MSVPNNNKIKKNKNYIMDNRPSLILYCVRIYVGTYTYL